MKRTQIYLDEDMLETLHHESRRRKMRMSGLIREALNEKYAKKKKNLEDFKALAGIWADRDFDVEKYIRNLRKDGRLKRLHGK